MIDIIRCLYAYNAVAMLQMLAPHRRVSSGVDLSFPVTTVRFLLWQRSTGLTREAAEHGCHAEVAYLK